MFRRWIIRSCFLLPILLCLIGWGVSVNHYAWYRFRNPPVYVVTQWGSVGIAFYPPGVVRATRDYIITKTQEMHWLVPSEYNFVWGFHYRSSSARGASYIPYWFLILLFAVPLFFIWRRNKPKKGVGFPVIVKS